MKTQIVIYHRPNRQGFIPPITGSASAVTNTYSFRLTNPNETITQQTIQYNRYQYGTQGLNLDLYDDVSIPITYTILDIREPEKRKTSWSKTITIPGTKNNNRIFSHIYEIGSDGWITIGSTSVYTGFNPNVRKEVIVLQDGIQVLKGNLQMKSITKDKDNNIQYEVSISGDLTSLFYDVGISKLSDLDFTELNHLWSKENISNSWYGINVNTTGTATQSIQNSNSIKIKRVYKDTTTGRLAIETSTAHYLNEDDYVYLNFFTGTYNSTNYDFLNAAKGEYIVTQRISSTKFVVNYFYPYAFMNFGTSISVPTATSYESWSVKKLATGSGYIYPMISWGDEYDDNSFPTTSFSPGVFIKSIFDKIMKMTGSTYESNFLNSQFFKRLFLIQRKPTYDISPAEVQERKFCVGLTQSYLTGASYKSVQNWRYFNSVNGNTSTPASILPLDYATNAPFDKESGSNGTASFYDGRGATGSIGNWDQTTAKWIVQDTGEYTLRANINLDAWVDMNGFTGGLANGTTSFNPQVQTNPSSLPAYLYYPKGWGNNPSGPLGSGNVGLQVKVRLLRKRNGVVDEIGGSVCDFVMNSGAFWQPSNANWPYFGRYQPASWVNRSIEVNSGNSFFLKNDEVWCEVSHFVQSTAGSWSNLTSRKCAVGFFEIDRSTPSEPVRSNINGEFYYKVQASSLIANEPSASSVEGSIIEAINFLPKDMYCKDFLLSIIKMFNLHIEADRLIEKKYYIEPRDTYYKNGSNGISDYVDWTDKLDSDSVSIIPLGELTAKYYTFQNKEESDYWNKKFKDDRGRAHMSYTKSIANDFLNNEVKIEVPLGSTVMINNPIDTDVVMPAILQKETNGSAKPVSNSLPRILIWGGLRPYTAGRGSSWINLDNSSVGTAYGYEIISTVPTTSATYSIYRQYPFAGTVDCAQDPVYDINWYNMEPGDFVYYDNARWTNENLYNKYWSNFIEEISDPASKLIIANLYLTPKDIFNLDFRKIYVIDGHYLRLQKIMDYDPVSDGLTKCEFLKLKSPTKFRRNSIITNSGGISNSVSSIVVDTTRPVSVTSVMSAPAVMKPLLGFNNTSSGTNLSNSSSVVTNGLSNFVASNTRSIQINGNENSVGNGATNINITSGNANYVIGGVKNVNIIGTDKKYIAESDVTYINDVRYKNGIAISKSNVINGGYNVANVRQSESTTVNVINGSEDVVITSGSKSYENIINSGLDRILPDLNELGISTSANPNSRTNLASSVLPGVTYSAAIQIRIAQANASK